MAIRRMVLTLALIGTMSELSPAAEPWAMQQSGTTARMRGLCVVSPTVAWASGTQGTAVRTIDGGSSWQVLTVPGAAELDFRDIEAFDHQTALVLSIGPGPLSRIYRTQDAGASWTRLYCNQDPRWFLDAIAFWDARHGLALGDPVDGRFVILTTSDGGQSWNQVPPSQIPPALDGEGAFAASGTCLVAQSDRNAWFATGGARVSRVFRSTDHGQTWTVHETPIRAGQGSAGIFSLAFRDAEHGVAVGGDYKRPELADSIVATTTDGGKTWLPSTRPQPAGYRSAVAFIPGAESPSLVTVGPSGSDFSTDDGQTWKPLGPLGFHAVGFAPRSTAGWAVGDNGRVARFQHLPAEP